jgi:hypothetical protein
MSESIIRNRNNLLGGKNPIENKCKSIDDILRDKYYNKINTCPIYQRHIRWKHHAMNDFIGTVMNNGLVPGLIMYELDSNEKTGKNLRKDYEMVDGQHRLYTLKAFMDATYRTLPHMKKQFIVYWNYQHQNEEGLTEYQHVFYKQTNDVIEYCQENKITPYYLNDEEMKHFDNYGLHITMIRNSITINQRREIFMSLQKAFL